MKEEKGAMLKERSDPEGARKISLKTRKNYRMGFISRNNPKWQKSKERH